MRQGSIDADDVEEARVQVESALLNTKASTMELVR